MGIFLLGDGVSRQNRAEFLRSRAWIRVGGWWVYRVGLH